MARQRNLLHRNHLPLFIRFCVERGWTAEPVRGEYEVLRMRHPSYADVLLVHERGKTKNGDIRQHLTVWGVSETLAREFFATMSRRQRHSASTGV